MKGRDALTGWGLTDPRMCRVHDLAAEDVEGLVLRAGPRGIIGRGLGRSYGNSAVNGGGDVVCVHGGLHFDPTNGIVACAAGTSIEDLYRVGIPFGWAVPVTPGTRQVTVAGAIAADVHGKNHHCAGTFGTHVKAINIVDGLGETHRIGPDDDRFWATVGGMGLTGVIVGAEIQLVRVSSAWIAASSHRYRTFAALVDAMSKPETDPFSVAWVDLSRRSGRGVLSRGRWAQSDEVDEEPYAHDGSAMVALPFRSPVNLVSRASVFAFNTAWWSASRDAGEQIVPLQQFFHPLDGVDRWNGIYGRRGFVQYQFVIGNEAITTLERIVADIIASGIGTPMVVLKRFGASNRAPLSFPIEGWTLAVDVPANQPDLLRTLRRYDEWVAAAGGRVYLAKDSHLERDVLETMYPNLGAWEAIQAQMDPDGRFVSDQARRLRLGVGGMRSGGSHASRR